MFKSFLSAPRTMASSSTSNSDAPRPGVVSGVLTLLAYPFVGHQEHLKVMARIDELKQKNDVTAADLDRRLAALHGTASGALAPGKEPSKPASSFLLLGREKASDKAPDAASAPGKLF